MHTQLMRRGRESKRMGARRGWSPLSERVAQTLQDGNGLCSSHTARTCSVQPCAVVVAHVMLTTTSAPVSNLSLALQVLRVCVLRADGPAPHLQRLQHPRPGQQDQEEQAGATAKQLQLRLAGRCGAVSLENTGHAVNSWDSRSSGRARQLVVVCSSGSSAS